MLDKYYDDINEVIGYSHSTMMGPGSHEFHLHDRFEIYFFISGDVNYFIENKVYKLEYGDLLIMNSHEIHRPAIKTNKPYERVVIHFDPTLPQLLSPRHFDLLRCFSDRKPGEYNRICLEEKKSIELMSMFEKMETLRGMDDESSKVLKLAYFLQILVFISHIYVTPNSSKEQIRTPEKLIPILEYINENLGGDLSLRELEEKFYINRYYLSRLFKKSTGSSLHEYIIYKRLALAKQLLAIGNSVTEASLMSGFGDYSNFIRTFKKKVGISPGKYKKEIR